MLGMITPPVCKIAHAFTHYIPSFPENQYLFLNFSPNFINSPHLKGKMPCQVVFFMCIFCHCTFWLWRKKWKKVLFCRKLLCQLKCIIPHFCPLWKNLWNVGKTLVLPTFFPVIPNPIPRHKDCIPVCITSFFSHFLRIMSLDFSGIFLPVFAIKVRLIFKLAEHRQVSQPYPSLFFVEFQQKKETVCFSSKRRY